VSVITVVILIRVRAGYLFSIASDFEFYIHELISLRDCRWHLKKWFDKIFEVFDHFPGCENKEVAVIYCVKFDNKINKQNLKNNLNTFVTPPQMPVHVLRVHVFILHVTIVIRININAYFNEGI